MKKWFIVFVLLILIMPVAFYGWSEMQAKQLAQGLPTGCDNSIKHAYGASLSYSAARKLFIPPKQAEGFVLKLGFLNERVERFIKRGRLDDEAEVSKDLYNNLVGIELSKWLENQTLATRENSLKHLCKTGGLQIINDKRGRPVNGAEIEQAINRHLLNRDELKSKINLAFDRM